MINNYWVSLPENLLVLREPALLTLQEVQLAQQLRCAEKCRIYQPRGHWSPSLIALRFALTRKTYLFQIVFHISLKIHPPFFCICSCPSYHYFKHTVMSLIRQLHSLSFVTSSVTFSNVSNVLSQEINTHTGFQYPCTYSISSRAYLEPISILSRNIKNVTY